MAALLMLIGHLADGIKVYYSSTQARSPQLRTTNAAESSFAVVRLRTWAAKRLESRARSGDHLAFARTPPSGFGIFTRLTTFGW